MFKPGDIAVLTHKHGGRLFEVESVTHNGWLRERSTLESQQRYAYEINPVHLIPCKSRDSAEALVERLTRANERYREGFAKLDAKRNRDWLAAVKSHKALERHS